MKKTLKITGITLLVVIVLIAAAPFLFQSQIQNMIKKVVNDNLNAHVEFSDVSLSFIRSFPKAHVSVSDLAITNFEPFKDETFMASKNIAFTMSIKELFKDLEQESLVIDAITIDEALLNLKTDIEGHNNYDITKESNNPSAEQESKGVSFDIQDYRINNSKITYWDEASKIDLKITDLNHEGKGVFSTGESELDTKTEAHVSFSMDSTNYLNNNLIKLDALIGMDLENSKYTFKENKGFVNQLPIEFKGYVQILEDGQDVDIEFENPESSFKSFLAVIPETYSKNIENVETTGDFKLRGRIYGKITENTIPKFNINIASSNASFKYPDLPKSVENINLISTIRNNTGSAEDTYVEVGVLDFRIDKDFFQSSATFKNLTNNMLVTAQVNGVLNLGNLTKAYPLQLENELSGILKANINTSFDVNALETNAFERVKASGTANITNFVFKSDAMNQPMTISKMDMTFNPSTVTLNEFNAKTGQSDITATGTINNLLGFVFSDTTLKGNFNLNSNNFVVKDFMSDEETDAETKNTETESLKIPAFLDCTINASANTVVYDNLNLIDVKGSLLIKDQQATLKDLTSSLFNGKLAVNGTVSTKAETPTFSFNLGADGFDISEAFNGLELLQNLAPIAKMLQGKLNTTIGLSGNLNDGGYTPNLSTVSGNALAEILNTKIGSTNETGLVSKLEGALGFVDFNKLDLKDLKTKLEFAEGKVSVKPFQLKYQDITIDVSGSHSFDKTMSYNAVFNVPAKYLGTEVNNLIAKIDSEEAKNITIPVTANIGGTYTNPTVKTDLTSGVTNLTNQLVEIQKQKLLNQGKDKVNSMLGDLISGNKSKTDSIKTQQNNSVKDVLGGLMGTTQEGKKNDSADTKTVDTTKTKTNTTTDAVKNVLGGFLGGKKKPKDTVN
ncbi:AsmA family protein [Flavobacteriaceae bacterium XHP0103]|uniref:AsmA family protein n=1 Tax=Marixanthotalea marina TaxID=2844359 RepID=UPI002989EB6C|nr:AsmA-like C-terminal region-containing protein [Marixanthotalea marina]MBU3821932.1 AsmA family protein [Marixanthotalea marina]